MPLFLAYQEARNLSNPECRYDVRPLLPILRSPPVRIPPFALEGDSIALPPPPPSRRRTHLLALALLAFPAEPSPALQASKQPPLLEDGGAGRVSEGIPGVALIPGGAVWKYLDTGIDARTAWRSPSFDDSKWKQGQAQLGYGDGDEKTVVSFGKDKYNKHITTYFRRRFTVKNSFKSAEIQLLRDDGAIVYLNGVEIVRSNMPPAGYIGHMTRAVVPVAGNEERRLFHFLFDPGLLRKGTNVLAVEIHQISPSSSDISFDLQLIAGNLGIGLVRGPYLQQPTPSSMVLCWRSFGPTKSVVWLGSSPTKLSIVHSSTTKRINHEILVKGLNPDTRYFYAIGTPAGKYAGGDGDHSFRTPPLRGKAKPTRVWVIGDSGNGRPSAAAVRDGFLKYAGKREAHLWLMLGDNAYYSGRDDEYQRGVFDMYPALLKRVPLWPAIGNHDSLSASSKAQSGVYFDVFSLPKGGEAGGLASGTEAWYSFDYGTIHFVCLDSSGSDVSSTGPMMKWLRGDLARSKASWNIAFWHHPPYTKGSHDSDAEKRLVEMRGIALPILEAGGIDLVLGGHSHSYERSYLLDSHYGLSNTLKPSMVKDAGDGDESGDGTYAKKSLGPAPHEGAVYMVVGCSSWVGGGTYNHPAMAVSMATLGSLVLDIDRDRLDARFIDVKGRVLDHFTIEKGLKRTLTRDLPSLSIGSGGTQNLFLDASLQNAGYPYLVLGSFGTSPGFVLGQVRVPLNPDLWFLLSFATSNGPLFMNTLGILDSKGNAHAGIRLAPNGHPGLLGRSLYHAYVVTGPPHPLRMASNPVRLRIVK